jgi:phosphatidylserine/phosphatidylglycerophosphate/cardiolipin synthase-like enzyme
MNNGVKANIDGTILIAGSFNYTKSAQSSDAENVLVLCNRRLTRAYREDIKTRMAKATPWTP